MGHQDDYFTDDQCFFNVKIVRFISYYITVRFISYYIVTGLPLISHKIEPSSFLVSPYILFKSNEIFPSWKHLRYSFIEKYPHRIGHHQFFTSSDLSFFSVLLLMIKVLRDMTEVSWINECSCTQFSKFQEKNECLVVSLHKTLHVVFVIDDKKWPFVQISQLTRFVITRIMWHLNHHKQTSLSTT